MARKTVVVEGLPELMAKASPAALAVPIRELLDSASDEALIIAKEAVKGGTNKAVTSMLQQTRSGSASVVSMMSGTYVKAIDKGRRSGSVVRKDIITLEKWASVVGYSDPRGLAVRIFHHGTPGKQFLKNTNEGVQAVLPRLLDVLTAKIKKWWG